MSSVTTSSLWPAFVPIIKPRLRGCRHSDSYIVDSELLTKQQSFKILGSPLSNVVSWFLYHARKRGRWKKKEKVGSWEHFVVEKYKVFIVGICPKTQKIAYQDWKSLLKCHPTSPTISTPRAVLTMTSHQNPFPPPSVVAPPTSYFYAIHAKLNNACPNNNYLYTARSWKTAAVFSFDVLGKWYFC